MFVEGPPPAYERERDFDCTSVPVVPALDIVLALPFILGGGLLIFDGSARDDALGGALLLVPGALFLGSGIGGFGKSADCRGALDALYERQLRAQQMRERPPRQSMGSPDGTRVQSSHPIAPHEAPVLIFGEPPSPAVIPTPTL
jgi:hypothetical protein